MVSKSKSEPVPNPCRHCGNDVDLSLAHVTDADGTLFHCRDDDDCYAIMNDESKAG